MDVQLVGRRRLLIFARVGAKGRRLDDLVAKDDVGESKAAADDAAVAEQLAQLARRSIGGDVEVFGRTTEQQVANAATDEVSLVATAGEVTDHLLGLRDNFI